jgi:hypothetical protein
MAEDFTLDFEGAEVGTLLAGARTLINGDAVRYSPQSASEAQKKQARTNIGAASAAEVTIYSGGIINLASSSVKTTIDSIMDKRKAGDIVLFIISDSQGSYPSLSETRVNVDASLCVELNYFFSTDKRGANVGDLLLVSKQDYQLVTRNACRIIPLNDAKAASGTWNGTDGVMTSNDKAALNAALPRAEQMPSRWTSNMNDALQTGVYVWCTLGCPSGATGAFTCVVFRTSTDDGSYDTIEQTAYGREGELGQVWKRIIFEKKDGSDTQFHDWTRIDPIDYKGDLGDLSGTKCSEFISTLSERMRTVTGKTGLGLVGRYTFSVNTTESKQELVFARTGSYSSYRLRGGLLSETLNNPDKFIDQGTSTYMREVIYDARRKQWYDISLPVINDASTLLDYFLEELEDSPDSLNTQMWATGEILKMGQNLARKIKAIEPVDVTALMTEGGTLAAEAVGGDLSSLLTRPLYVKTDVYLSTVHVSVANRVWYLVAHRIGYSDGAMYRVQRVAECTATDNVMTCNKVTESKE